MHFLHLIHLIIVNYIVLIQIGPRISERDNFRAVGQIKIGIGFRSVHVVRGPTTARLQEKVAEAWVHAIIITLGSVQFCGSIFSLYQI